MAGNNECLQNLMEGVCCDFYAFGSMRESMDGEPVLNETHFIVGRHVRNETHLMLEYIEYSSNVDIYTRLCAIRL